MPMLMRSLVSRLVRRFRSRAFVELENLALRHQLYILRRQRPGSATAVYFRPLALVLALPILAALSRGDGVGQAGNGDSVAPSGIPSILEMALEIRTPVSGARDSRSDSSDEQRQRALRSPSDPRRTAQARH
jgi:hypothetical protein